tara:strand:+ start:1201 stop:2127 length:927 start_codon:yes stop_codon:yes gene_type:complete
MKENQYEINSKSCFRNWDKPSKGMINLREHLYKRFSNQMSLLLESKRPRKCYSTKGKLSTRKLYQSPFNDSIFTQSYRVPTSDTTILMLLDASSSMGNHAFNMNGYDYDCIEVASAVASAFAKSVRECVGDSIKLEVFLKTCSNSNVRGALGIQGAPVELIRIYSNTKKRDCDLDKVLLATTNSPLIHKEQGRSGSCTPEYSVLPSLFKWVGENVTTKNICIFNITDGETYANVGDNFYFSNRHTRELREKYLRFVDNITLYIGKEVSEKDKEIYGDNVIGNRKGDSSSFIQPMFNTLIKLFNNATDE